MCFLNPAAENTTKIKIKNRLGDETSNQGQQQDNQAQVNQAVAEALAQQQQEKENNERPEEEAPAPAPAPAPADAPPPAEETPPEEETPTEETPTDPDAGQDTADAEQDTGDVADTTADDQPAEEELVLVGYDQNGDPVYESKKKDEGKGSQTGEPAGGAGGQGTAGGTA